MPSPPEVVHPRRTPRGVAVLTVVAGAILLAGILLRPGPRETVPPPAELDLGRLTRLSQRRAMENTTQFLTTLAGEHRDSVVWVEALGTSGVAWRPNLVVVPASRQRLAPPPQPLRRVVSGPHLPIAAFENSSGTPLRAAAPAISDLAAGEWIVAIWHLRDGWSFAPAVYTQTQEQRCGDLTVRALKATLPMEATMSGAGIFDVDGALRGMVAPCDGRLAIISYVTIEALLEEGRQLVGRLLAEVGFRAGPLSLDEAAHLKMTSGVIVREVWNGYPADVSGLRPGDVIRTIDGEDVKAPADLEALLEATDSQPRQLMVARGSQSASIDLNRGAAGGLDRPAGLVFESERMGYQIDAVTPGSAAFNSGLRAGDIILRINHAEPRNFASLKRLLGASHSVSALLEIQRGERRFAVLMAQR